jgi:hypothetical protein
VEMGGGRTHDGAAGVSAIDRRHDDGDELMARIAGAFPEVPATSSCQSRRIGGRALDGDAKERATAREGLRSHPAVPR